MTVERPGSAETGISRSVDLGKKLVSDSSLVLNLRQHVIVITRDKLELALIDQLPRYARGEQLLASLALFVGLSVALLTSEFKKRFGVDAAQWQAIFAIATIASALWLGRDVLRYFRRRSVHQIADEIERKGDPS